ncbi:hypothetical protein OGAPHI_002571 [Ogataea philodendri]|uniref:F-box domain-containing protein n=1 Tax=Ogataea philodendri TaxID=1378263 RepID=A0A9P8PBN3_9ASCO|nr:uncharacterized protein OGAPHI_002571 [Ogataea philodendri]KAH3668816.1 hypothetical protein OGAPHI_002571 [Ogataea philodendri]
MLKGIYFPVEVWYLIAENLHAEDWINLRATNSQLYLIFSANELWKPLVIETWYKYTHHQDTVKDQYWLGLYYKHVNADRVLRNKLHSLENLQHQPGSQVWNVLSPVFEDPDLYVPELVRLSQHLNTSYLKNGAYHKADFDNLLTSRLNNLRCIYLASSVLRAIRLCKMFQYEFDYFRRETDNENFETLEDMLMHFSYIDPFFYEFYEYRERTLKSVEKAYRELELDNTVSNTAKVKQLASLLQEQLYRNSMAKTPFQTEQTRYRFCEDFCLLRVYAGDVIGAPECIHAIMHKLCDTVDIPVRVNKANFIVEDPTVRGGTSHFIIYSYKTVQINIDEILNTSSPSIVNIYRSYITCKELKLHVASLFFEAFSLNPRIPSTIHPQALNDDELHVSALGDRIQGQILGFYCADDFSVRIFTRFWSIRMRNWNTRPRIFDTGLVSVFFLSNQIAFLSIGLITVSSKYQELAMLYEDLKDMISKQSGRCISMDMAHGDANKFTENRYESFEAGQLVLHRGIQPLLVLGFDSSEKPESCRCMKLTGGIFISLPRNLVPFCYDSSEFDAAVKQFAIYDELGAYFTKFDEKTKRFILINNES